MIKRKLKSLIPESILRSRWFILLNLFIQIQLPKFLRLQLDKIYMRYNLLNFLKENELKKYDDYYKNQPHRFLEHKKQAELFFFMIDGFARQNNCKSILDVGCGYGFLIKKLLASGYEAKGVDISQYVIDNYSSDLKEKKIIFNSFSSQLPFEDNSFDLVISHHLLEHIPDNDVDNTLEGMFRVCKNLTFNIITLQKSASLNKIEYHLTVKNKEWWENKFLMAGFKIFQYQSDDLENPLDKEAYFVFRKNLVY